MSFLEPARGTYATISLFSIMLASPTFVKRAPVLSDIFVFSYPLFLLGCYCYALVKEWKHLSSDAGKVRAKEYFWGVSKTFWIKSFLISIFFIALTSIGVNILIQQFFTRERPYIFFSTQGEGYIAKVLQDTLQKKSVEESVSICFLGSCIFSSIREVSARAFEGFRSLVTQKTHHQTLLHAFLPKTSFPSDHAAISFAIAVGVLYGSLKVERIRRKILKDDGKLLSISPFPRAFFFISGCLFFCFASIMAIGRVMTGVHWPTDIIAGAILGTVVGFLFFQQPVWFFVQKNVVAPIICCEQKVCRWCKSFLQKCMSFLKK